MRRNRPTTVGFLIGVLILSGLPLLTAAPASAGVCHFGGAGWEGDYDTQNHYGVAVNGPGIDVNNYNSDCFLAQSVYVWQTSNNFAEAGWYEENANVTACTDVSAPHFLAFVVVDGTPGCQSQVGSPSISQAFHGFKLENDNHNLSFTYWLDGDVQVTQTTNFTQGEVFAGVERHEDGDHLGAEFDGLKWLGAAGSWNSWDQLSGVKDQASWDNVSDYSFCWISNHHFKVRTNC